MKRQMNKMNSDLICFCHLRWGFVYQRPQHLMSRFAKAGRVFFVEEPVIMKGEPGVRIEPGVKIWVDEDSGVRVVVPQLPAGLSAEQTTQIQRALIRQLIETCRVEDYYCWYYTPMALSFTRELDPSLVVYDCMDELSAFKNAPAALRDYERELFEQASLVFTGGQSLYEAKRAQHPDVHAFPSSVDVRHFAQARVLQPEPDSQAQIPHPRIGYCGVIDERMDLDLIAGVADARPHWQLVMVGPVVKIDQASLPRNPNIHYLGARDYKELPKYLAGWDAAMLPFARNESTRFISPTKTPEYLAAGKPSVSTSIRDVVRPYGEMGLVEIADSANDFVAALERALETDRTTWQTKVDRFL